MFSHFESQFRKDPELPQTRTAKIGAAQESILPELLPQFAGRSFNNGLYRFMTTEVRKLANEFIARAFPSFSGRVVCFAYDWLGRIFALDSSRLEDGSPAV